MTRVEQILMIATALLGSVAGAGWYTSAPRSTRPSHTNTGDVAAVAAVQPESIDASLRTVIETDPFRLDRRPSAIAYQAGLEGLAPAPRLPKPPIVLVGLVGGAALIDGAPGHVTTVILHAGDTIGGLRIRRVGRDTVIVAGSDTTWRLTLRQSWQ
ncbi:MAG TPA: hypothetical protein VNV25_02365 [Gemmatimonadaceae bacterium]|jgi:hypothetical protein|nr:hypothetical protein [Gemmatimonadaceae bacterium]